MNLVNDPIFNPENEYCKLKKELDFEPTNVVPYCGTFDEYTTNEEVKKYDDFWNDEINSKILNAFNQVVSELNKNNIFYFGCPLNVYIHTFNERLEQYSSENNITDDSLFIKYELDFLNTILNDYNSYARDKLNYSVEYFNKYKLGFEIITIISYKTYLNFHNQKIDFLNSKFNNPQSKNNISNINYHYLLDDDLLNNILKSNGIIKFNFENRINIPIVVKEVLDHNYLMNHFEIGSNTLDFYYKPTKDILIDEEFNNLKLDKYSWRINRVLLPFNIEFLNVYFLRWEFYIKLMSLKHDLEYEKIIIPDNFHDDVLLPAFEEYALGFQQGFNEFENQKINLYLNHLSDKYDFYQKVFDFIISNPFIEKSWINQQVSFSRNPDSKSINLSGANNCGLLSGYFYKAWSIIFSQNTYFEPLFEKLNKDNNINIGKQQSQESNLTEKIIDTPLKPKKPSDKWHALLYIVELKMKGEKPPLTFDGEFDKKLIQKIGMERCKSTGQSFYKSVKEIWDDRNIDYSNFFYTFSRDWKDRIFQLSKNNQDVKEYLDTIK